MGIKQLAKLLSDEAPDVSTSVAFESVELLYIREPSAVANTLFLLLSIKYYTILYFSAFVKWN